jgi:hypothetical protein
VSPYREAAAAAPAAPKPHRLKEDDRAPTRKLSARSWSNGVSRISVRSDVGWLWTFLVGLGAFSFSSAALLVLATGVDSETGRGAAFFGIIGAILLARLVWSLFGGERYFVGPSGLIRKQPLRPWRRTQVYTLDELSTVVVIGEEGLDLQVGRKRVPLCLGLGHRGENLRWIARRLRRAIDQARAR